MIVLRAKGKDDVLYVTSPNSILFSKSMHRAYDFRTESNAISYNEQFAWNEGRVGFTDPLEVFDTKTGKVLKQKRKKNGNVLEKMG